MKGIITHDICVIRELILVSKEDQFPDDPPSLMFWDVKMKKTLFFSEAVQQWVTDLPWTLVFLSLLNWLFAAQQEQARDHSKSLLKYNSNTVSETLVSSELGYGHCSTIILIIPWEAAMWTHAFQGEWWLILTNALRLFRPYLAWENKGTLSSYLDCLRDTIDKDTKMFEVERIFYKEGPQAELDRLHSGREKSDSNCID